MRNVIPALGIIYGPISVPALGTICLPISVPSPVTTRLPILISALIAICGFLAAPTIAHAQHMDHPFAVDQANDAVLTNQGYVVPIGSPVGQEFRPLFFDLDVVELYMNTQLLDQGGIAQVRIRFQTITGAILGESGFEFVPPIVQPKTLMHFDFDPLVQLTPGWTYVMEVVAASGRLGVFTSGFGNNTYPNGAAIFQGEREPGTDLWFREGSSAYLPIENATWGSIKALYGRR